MPYISICSSVFSAVLDNRNEKPNINVDLANEHQLTKQEVENINTCTQNLKAIGEALHAYENRNGCFPEWLSELYPNYLTETNFLVCPSDEDKGVPILPYDTDPNLPTSYTYDCTPEYYEQWLKRERHVYDGKNPIVQCSHHKSPDSDSSLYLNLSFSNSIYISKGDWRKQPISVFGSLDAAISGLERALEIVPDDPAFFYHYPELQRLYLQAGNVIAAENLIDRFKSVMKPHDENIMRFRDYWTYVEMLKISGEHQKALKLLLHLEETEKENPFRASIFREIAMIYEETDNAELADAYYNKADSRLAMIGKPAPDFSITDVDGNTISLKDFRGKVLLIDFWSTTCGPCIGEMPNVRKVYDEFNAMGFEVIGISLDEDEERLYEFLNTCNLPWRQVFTGEGWETPVRKLYKVRGIPSPWLIDKDGNVISYKARGSELRRLVSEAVDKKV